MKTITSRILVFILCICPLIPCFSRDTVRITVGEWPPYLSDDGKEYGLAAQIVTESFAAVGMEADYVFYPWQRAYTNAAKGEADATLLWVKTPERELDFIFSDVVISGMAAFFHLRNFSFDWKNYADLEGYRIGGLLSASYPWFEEAKKEGVPLTMDLVIDEEANFRKLLIGRIDIFSLDVIAADGILNKYFSPEERELITYHPHPIEVWDYCLLVSRKISGSNQLVSRFNQGLRELHETGRYDEILAEYQKSKE